MTLTRLLTFVALLGFVSPAVAQECESGNCPFSNTSLTSNQQEESCPIMTAAMEKLPKMTFQVGEESTCCSVSAEALAKEHSQPIRFVVDEKTYEDKTEAYTALVSQTEEFVNEFVTPCKCEASGNTTLAGQTCDCPVTSAKYAEQVKAAVDSVSMSYKVGEETCDCPKQAASIAKSSDADVEFVVGEQCTSCELTGRLNLAHARYKAAVAAINQATAPTDSGS